MEIYEKIRYYHEHTELSQRNVAKMLGISRNTVKKYWEGQTVPWERKPGSGRKNDVITDEVRDFIIKCIESDKNAPRKQHHTAHKIYERLVDEYGFEGCEASVRRTVAELRCKVSNVFVPLAYEPAEAIQVDWGEATIILAGIKQKIQIWCMRECYSGDIFVAAFYRQNEESFLEGIVKGLDHFGGTPQKIIFDNARVAVNHFVLNSVSFADGKHYHDNKKNLRLLRKRSDELCREYALSVIEHPSGRKKPYALYQAEKQGLPTRDTVARQAVDEAISKSFTLKDFDRELSQMGYRINFDPNRKYWTIKGKGWDRPKRLYKLGEDYTNDRILERIKENSYTAFFTASLQTERTKTPMLS